MTLSTLKTVTACVCGVLVAHTLPGTSASQERSAIEEIVVTAQKREQSLQDTPIAVTAFSQDALNDIDAIDVESLIESVPTISVTRTDGNAVQITLRGITSTNNTELGDPAVSFNVDGIYMARPQAASALMFDVERVEVLRGPQGTLYGRNSPAGAINLVTRKPGSEFDGSVGVVAGDYSRRGLKGTLNLPVSETFALRFAALSEQRDSYNTAGPNSRVSIAADETPDTDDELAGRISALWTPSDDFSWLLTYDSLNSESLQPLAVRGLDAPDIRSADLNIPSSLDMDTTSFRSRIDWNFSETVGLSYLASVNSLDIDFEFSGLLGGANRTRNSENESTSHELQLKTLDANAAFEWILGAFWFEENTDNDFIIDINPFFGLRFRQPDRSSEAAALFGQGTYHFNDTTSLTFGFRQSDDTKEDIGGSNQICPGGVDPITNCFPTTNNTRDNSWDEPTWRVQLDWNGTENTFFYGSVATGYKAGGFGDQGTPDYDQETLLNYELGMKSDLADGTLRINTALYYSDYEDLQVTAVEGTGGATAAAVTRNAASATIKGLETEFTWLPNGNSRFQGFVSYMDAQFGDFPGGVDTVFAEGVIQNFGGNTLPFSPEWSLLLAYDIDFSLPNGGTIRPRVSLASKDEYFLRAVNRPGDDLQDSHSIIDASIRYTSPNGNWSVEAFGKNLGDEGVKVNGAGGGGGGEGVLDYTYRPPRTWGVRLDYGWGS